MNQRPPRPPPTVLQALPHLGAGGAVEGAVQIAAALAAAGGTADRKSVV